MKVAITAEMKNIITINEMPAVRKVIEQMKEENVKQYAEMAARIASGSNFVKVLEANAEIAFNCRVWDAYDNGTESFDVWVNFTAYTGNGFVMGGTCVTDLWNATGDNNHEIRKHMYIRSFTEDK